MTQQYDRFNLEEEIMNVWQTRDDLDAVTDRIIDDPMTEDQTANVLIGLSELFETRCKKLWKVFETMVHEKSFNERNNGKKENGSEITNTETNQD